MLNLSDICSCTFWLIYYNFPPLSLTYVTEQLPWSQVMHDLIHSQILIPMFATVAVVYMCNKLSCLSHRSFTQLTCSSTEVFMHHNYVKSVCVRKVRRWIWSQKQDVTGLHRKLFHAIINREKQCYYWTKEETHQNMEFHEISSRFQHCPHSYLIHLAQEAQEGFYFILLQRNFNAPMQIFYTGTRSGWGTTYSSSIISRNPLEFNF
jgi:hypothetical protein